MKNHYQILSFFLIFISYGLKAQQPSETGFTLDIKSAGFSAFVEKIEEQSDVRFYYIPEELQDFSVTIKSEKQPLNQILNLLFKDSDFRFFVINRKVYITSGQNISMRLPDNLFKKEEGSSSYEEEQMDIPEFLLESTSDAERNLENKLIILGNKFRKNTSGEAVISGMLKESKTGEPLIGALVYVEKPMIGVSTDHFGKYSLRLPLGRHEIKFRGVGYRDTKRQVVVYSDDRLDIELHEKVTSLKEVVISGERTANVDNVNMGVEKVSIQQIKELPAVLGEPDVLKAALTLPGIQSVGEASTGLNVRGGATDQNLILFDDLTIYNPSHFFGMFSAFNPETIKDMEIYKSSIPANYGGRLSSVIDVNSRIGNKKNFEGSAGLGLLTSRLNLEGPIVNDKSSFLVGGRTTYSNWIFKLLPENSGFNKTRASFHDLNAHLHHEIDENNTVALAAYYSNDFSNLNTDTLYGYSNKNIALKWYRKFNDKLFGKFTTGFDSYSYNIRFVRDPETDFNLDFGLNQKYLKADFNYFFKPALTIDFGLSTINYTLNPGHFKPVSPESTARENLIEQEQALESAFYIQSRYDVNPRLSVNAGLRYSVFNYLGPKNVNEYPLNSPKDDYTFLGSVYHEKGSIINTYHGPEYRLSARYSVTNDFSIKAGYNTLRQYIHMLSNTMAISPTDIWKLSDPNLRPQLGDQLSVGFFKNFLADKLETSVELYHKNIQNYLDFKNGAVLILNHHIEREVINTTGKAYGAEFLIKKPRGRLNGWVSYTYSRTLLRMDEPYTENLVNQGNWYPASFDKPHDFTMIGNYKFSHRYSVSWTTTYSTGRPISVPIGTFYHGNSQRSLNLFSERNTYRIPDYFRTDISVNIKGNHKVHQLAHNSWTFGIYNLTGRRNPYSVYFTSENGVLRGYKLSIFGTLIPFINYNIRF